MCSARIAAVSGSTGSCSMAPWAGWRVRTPTTWAIRRSYRRRRHQSIADRHGDAACTHTDAGLGWQGEYYANPSLQRLAQSRARGRAIDFNWEYNAPVPGIPTTGFSVRWFRDLYFFGRDLPAFRSE